MQLFLCDRCGITIPTEVAYEAAVHQGKELLCEDCVSAGDKPETFACDRCHNSFPLKMLKDGDGVLIVKTRQTPGMILCRRCATVSRAGRNSGRNLRYLFATFLFLMSLPVVAIAIIQVGQSWQSQQDHQTRILADKVLAETRSLQTKLAERKPEELAALRQELDGLRSLLLANKPTTQPKSEASKATVVPPLLLAELVESLAQKSIAPVLQKARQGGSAEKVAAVLAIAKRRDQSGTAFLLDGLQDPDPIVRAMCARVLGAIGAQAGISRLLAAVKDPEPWVRKAAAQSLSLLTREEFVFFEDVPPEKWQKLQQLKEKLKGTGKK